MVNSKNTQDLIEDLVRDLPHKSLSASWQRRFLGTWGVSFVSLLGLTILIATRWPDDARLPDHPFDARFLFTGLSWLGASVTCAYVCYLHAIPLSRKNRGGLSALIAIVVLAASLFTGENFQQFQREMPIEFALGRGPCGVLIFVASLLTACFVLFSLRRAAPSNFRRLGIWTSGAAGALSAFFMHLVCRHESAAHVVLWHLAPILIMTILIMRISYRLANQIPTKSFRN